MPGARLLVDKAILCWYCSAA